MGQASPVFSLEMQYVGDDVWGRRGVDVIPQPVRAFDVICAYRQYCTRVVFEIRQLDPYTNQTAALVWLVQRFSDSQRKRGDRRNLLPRQRFALK